MLANVDLSGATLPLSRTHSFAMLINALVPTSSEVRYQIQRLLYVAPYRLPAQLDLDRMESLLTARRSTAEDHFWSLREDPSYFCERLFEMKDHRREMLLDLRGKQSA